MPEVQVPAVIGLPRPAAEAQLKAANLLVGFAQFGEYILRRRFQFFGGWPCGICAALLVGGLLPVAAQTGPPPCPAETGAGHSKMCVRLTVQSGRIVSRVQNVVFHFTKEFSAALAPKLPPSGAESNLRVARGDITHGFSTFEYFYLTGVRGSNLPNAASSRCTSSRLQFVWIPCSR